MRSGRRHVAGACPSGWRSRFSYRRWSIARRAPPRRSSRRRCSRLLARRRDRRGTGGLVAGLVASTASFLALNFFFTPRSHSPSRRPPPRRAGGVPHGVRTMGTMLSRMLAQRAAPSGGSARRRSTLRSRLRRGFRPRRCSRAWRILTDCSSSREITDDPIDEARRGRKDTDGPSAALGRVLPIAVQGTGWAGSWTGNGSTRAHRRRSAA